MSTKPKSKSRKMGFWKKALLVLNIIGVSALILSFSALYVSPKTYIIPAFAGLAYPCLLSMNLIFMVMWLFLKPKFALLSLITIIVGWLPLRSLMQLHIGKNIDTSQCIRVMNYNVRNFDLYNYNKDWSYNYEKRDKIYTFLNEEQADVICFQEFVHDMSGGFKTIDTLVTFLKASNVHFEYTVESKKINRFGIATFSRFPIVSKGMIDFPNSRTNLAIFTDIVFNADTIRVYNAHFESLHFDEADYKVTEAITTGDLDEDENNNIKQGSMRVLRLMKRAFVKRQEQVKIVMEHISGSPYPVILCADLNDTPVSYAYHLISKKLDDAFIQSGYGFGHTYTTFLPSFRIDYIFVSEALKSYNMKIYRSKYSDHYPISCYIGKR